MQEGREVYNGNRLLESQLHRKVYGWFGGGHTEKGSNVPRWMPTLRSNRLVQLPTTLWLDGMTLTGRPFTATCVGSRRVLWRARNRASIPAGSEILPPVGMGVAQCLTSTSKDGEWTRAWHKKGKRRLQQVGGFPRAILTW